MEENIFEEIAAEMALPVETPLQKLLRARKITPETQVQKHRFLMQYRGVDFLPRGELVAISGKAKQGKTFFTSILMTQAIRPEPEPLLGIVRAEAPPLRVLWIDTEQSEDSMQEILVGRLLKPLADRCANAAVGTPGGLLEERISCYSLRRDNWQDRWGYVVAAIAEEKPDLVVLDGVRDLIGDINDYEQAQTMLDKLLQQASETQACLLCVLHENKSAEDHNLRGAIGTELTNKAFEIYTCKKDPEQYFFQVQQTATRKNEIREKIYFTVGEDGLPISYTPETENEPAAANMTNTLPPYRYMGNNGKMLVDFPKLFADILADGNSRTETEISSAAHALGVHLTAESMQRFLGYAVERRIIVPSPTANGQSGYGLASALSTAPF